MAARSRHSAPTVSDGPAQRSRKMMKFNSMLSKEFLKNNPSTRLKTFNSTDAPENSLAARRRISMQLKPECIIIQNNLTASQPIFPLPDTFKDGCFSMNVHIDDALCQNLSSAQTVSGIISV
jgi:hypothetical protein